MKMQRPRRPRGSTSQGSVLGAVQRALRHGTQPSPRMGAGVLVGCIAVSVEAAPALFPAILDLSSLDGTNGFALNGITHGDLSGFAVSGAGDVNGDGVDDILIGAISAEPSGRDIAGESYIVFGRTMDLPAAFELRSLRPIRGGDGSTGFILAGIDPIDRSGFSVSRAGDVNADGLDDLLISTVIADPGSRSDAGESYLVFGRATGFPAILELRSLHPDAGGDGSTGFILEGADPFDLSGISVSEAGDVNGDGIDDLIVGALYADPSGRNAAGESYVVFGRVTGFPAIFALASLDPAAGGDGSAGFVLGGINALDYSGNSVSEAGDVNGDGIDDLIIGARKADPNGRGAAGESYVVFGRATPFPPFFDLASLDPGAGGDGSAGFILWGIDGYDYAGGSVSGAHDVNGDGIDDLIIGAYGADPGGLSDAGESYVVFGRATPFPAVFDLASLRPAAGGDGSAGFILGGIGAYDYSGRSVSGAGDINGDGFDDLIIGAYGADPGGLSDAGESYVVFGRATPFPAAIDLRRLLPALGGDGSAGFIARGIRRADRSGGSVSGAGDVNGDGIDDVLIGADGVGFMGVGRDAGQSYVVFGRDSFAGNYNR